MSFQTRRFPKYYVPPGVATPAHIFDRVGVRLLPGGGPDGQGGTMHHGPYFPAQADDFVQTPAGWWVRLADATPEHLLRTHAVPGVVIEGAIHGHRWLVPVLLTLQKAVPDWLLVMGLSPTGSPHWCPMAGLDELIERLRCARLGQLNEEETWALAIDLLARNHHVGAEELAIGGWLLKPMAVEIVLAACSITPEIRAAL